MTTPYEVEKKKNLSECLGRIAKQGTIGALIFGAVSGSLTYAAFKKCRMALENFSLIF
jgi:hypothetical protein